MVSTEYSEAMVEVLDILKHTDEELVNKIPKKLIEFFEENKSKTYKCNLDHSVPINKMKLQEKTKALISMLYISYLCDKEEKEKIEAEIKNTVVQKEQQEMKLEAVKAQELKRQQTQQIEQQKVQKTEQKEEPKKQEITEYKEPFFKRIINMLKNMFKSPKKVEK